MCLIGDNAAVNTKTAELCKKPHIGCKNHKLNLEVKEMMKNDIRLSETIESVQRLMLSLKTIKNAAVLDAYTNFRPTLYVKTRWSGKFKILQKLLKLYDVPITIHEDDENPFKIAEPRWIH
jgi:hypothetical protein